MSVRVLYILGSGRNGSTILANIIGSCDDFVSVGELYFIWDRGFRDNRRCGCGSRFLDCVFWSEVTARAGIDSRTAMDGLRLRQELARTRNALRPGSLALRERFQELLGLLYGAVAETARAETVVDSSKLPVYGNILSNTVGINTHGLLLVRDPRAVAYSWSRLKLQPDMPGETYMARHGLVNSTAMWMTWNALTEILWRNRHDHFLILRYEDFVRGPDEAFREIGDMIGRSVSPPRADDGAFELRPSHTVSGNPVRFNTERAVLRLDDQWTNSMSRARRLAVATVSFPLLVRYGYMRHEVRP